MKIIQRLYLKDFFRLLILITFGLSMIFSLIDLIGKIDNFLSVKSSVWSIALYAFFNVPRFLLYLLPMSVLICSLFTFGQAFRRHEIAAIKAAGGRLKALFYPFIATGILLSIFAFFTNEVIVPDFARRATELKSSLEGKEKKSTFADGAIWLKSRDGSPVKIGLYLPEKKIARDVGIFISGREFLKEMLIAEEAVWNGSAWLLNNVRKYDIETGMMEKIRSMEYAGLESPELFAGELKTPDEMGIYELYRYIQRLKTAGFSNLNLIVDLNSKISFPLINIFMMLLGIALSSRTKKGGGLVTAGLGLLISLFYWLGFTFSLTIGYAGIIPPALAAWAVPALFGTLSLYLFLETPE
ncbi:MAG: LptF/LptG family permease [Nitrospirota bacterium]|nr:LptF/LptG family permease [Nitrospirota bacterium]